jgi:NitT/TauT family transport system substrate-binding protein
MRKLLIFMLLLPVLIFSYTLLNPFGPTLMPVAFIISKDVGADINVQMWRTPDEAIAAVKANRADFYVLPLTMAANLHAAGLDLVLIGVHEWKVFYLVGREDIKGWKDLRGKEIYVAHSRGTIVDVLLRMFLKKSGLDPEKDVKLVYAQPPEIVALFKSGKASFAAIPEPFVTMLLRSGKILFDFQKEWQKFTGLPARIPIAGLFTTKEFLRENEEGVNYAEISLKISTDMMNISPRRAAEIVSNITKMPQNILEVSVKRMVFEYVPSKECRKEVEEFLRVLKEEYPEGIKEIPDESFYR